MLLLNFSYSQWVPISTGLPNGGNCNVYSLLVDSSNIFAGTQYGAYVLSSNGTTWNSKNFGFPQNGSYTTINAFIKKDSLIFAGTNSGIYSILENGSMWVPSGLANKYVQSFTIIDTNFFSCASDSNGVYLSTNNGITWTPKYNGIPANSGALRTVVDILTTSFGIFAIDNPFGIYRTLNNGNYWSCVLNGVCANSFANISNGLYVGSCNNGVLYSPDGINWTNLNTGLPSNGTTMYSVNCISVSGNTFFAGLYNKGIYYSTNNGDMWTSFNTGLPFNTSVNTIVFIDNNIYIGTNTGVYRRFISETTYNLENLSNTCFNFNYEITNKCIDLTFNNCDFSNVDLQLFNSFGKRIKNYKIFDKQSKIDISELSDGIYIVKVISSGNIFIKKILKIS